MFESQTVKRLDFIGSSREDLKRFPEERFQKVIYVLHCFQKKSKHGIKTPKQEVDLIQQRLRAAEEDYHEHYA